MGDRRPYADQVGFQVNCLSLGRHSGVGLRFDFRNLLPAGGPARRAMGRPQCPSRLQPRAEDAHRAPAPVLVDLIHGLPQCQLPLPISTS